MSAVSLPTSHALAGSSTSSTSRASTPSLSLWICQSCKVSLNEEHTLVQSDGLMVCPSCAQVDASATSANYHVDLSADQSSIFDPLQSLQTLDAGWAFRAQKYDRRFMAQVDTLMTTFLQNIVGNTSFHIQNGVKLWFRDVQEADKIDKGVTKLMQHGRNPRVAVMMALAVRMACQEVNLSSLYGRLKGKKIESRNAVKGYTKGDDRVPVLSHLEFFAKNQELPLTDPGRFKTYDLFRDITNRFHQILDYRISPCDYIMSLVLRVLRHLTPLVNATSGERTTMMVFKEGHKFARKGWPDQPLDALKRVSDWDDVVRMAHDLWQAQNCVLLFADETPQAQAAAAIALTLVAAETVMGDSLPNNADTLCMEMGHYLNVGQLIAKSRRPELEKFIMCWSTSLPEAGLPTPPIKRLSKRSSQLGGGTSGWGSDKRRALPIHVIVPVAARAVAAHWKELKTARLRRPGVIPAAEEVVLCKRLFAGSSIDEEVADLLAKHCGPSASAEEDDVSDDGTDIATVTAPEPARNRWSSVPSDDNASTAVIATEPARPVSKTDMVQSWIENGDASSGDEGESSDEETPRAIKRIRREPTYVSIGELPQPFAFSVGQTGFQVEKVAAPSSSSAQPVRATAAPSAALSRRSASVETTRSGDGLTAASDACPMERQPSATPSSRSVASTSGNSVSTSSTASRPAPLRATASPAPIKIIKGERVSTRAEAEALQRGLNDPNDHNGVLVRERKEFCPLGKKRVTLRKMISTIDSVVLRSVNFWLDKQQQGGLTIPDQDSQEYLNEVSAKSDGPIDVRDRLTALADRQSPLETLLRLGVRPTDLPNHVVPHSACGVNLDLFHFADRKAILGEGVVEETDELRDKSLRLFFRGPCNDSLEDVFLDGNGIKERITSYHHTGFWDCLPDSSPLPKPKFRKRKREDQENSKPVLENMIQRIAYEEGKADLSGEAETEMIQKAALAALLFVKPQPIWDPFKVTGLVPKLWFDDGLYERGLVTASKLSASEAWDTAETTWARRKQVEEAVVAPGPE